MGSRNWGATIRAGAAAGRNIRSATARTNDGRGWAAPAALAAAAGLLLIAAFPPFDVDWLAWIALTPLVLALHRRSLRQAFGLGYLAGCVAFGGILAWIRVFGLLPWLLLTAYLALYPAVFAALARWYAGGRPAWRWVWWAALTWAGLEYLRSVGITGFPWALLGTTQHQLLPVLQIARYTGVYGVSFLVALIGVSLAGAVQVRRPAPIVVPVALLALAIGWGIQQVRPVPSGALMVGVIQPNIPQAQKFDPTRVADHLQTLRRLVDQAGRRGADLIIFPETAVPLNLFGPGGGLVEIGRWAQLANATIIASSLENGVANIAVAVAPSGMAGRRYDKVRLVAFGEAGIVPGSRHEPLWTPVGRVGVAICFESIFPEVSRALVGRGAQLLAVITNDAWLDGTAGPAQHAAQAVLRAVENGRWLVRAANTGISMIVAPTGAVRAIAPAGQEAVLTAAVMMVQPPTFYAKRGDLFMWAALAALLVAASPALLAALYEHWTRPAFHQAAVAVGLPWVTALVALQTRAPGWMMPTLLVVFSAVFALLQPSPRSGPPFGARHRPRRRSWRFLVALAGGVLVILVLWGLMLAAFRASGVPLSLRPLAGEWMGFLARQLLVAAALELWLRGAAFATLAEWQGQPIAVAVTTALGVSLQAGLPVEAYAWTLVTGAAFGLIRSRAGSPAGLIVPHALGNLLFSAVASVR
jgi:apolipoprotein N-acyltransferase